MLNTFATYRKALLNEPGSKFSGMGYLAKPLAVAPPKAQNALPPTENALANPKPALLRAPSPIETTPAQSLPFAENALVKHYLEADRT